METNKRIGLEQLDNSSEEKSPQLCIDKSAEFAKQVCEDEPEYVERYNEGKKVLLTYLLGRLMKISRGACNPALAKDALLKELEARK